MNCSKCGEPLTENDIFCPKCGTLVQKSTTNDLNSQNGGSYNYGNTSTSNQGNDGTSNYGQSNSRFAPPNSNIESNNNYAQPNNNTQSNNYAPQSNNTQSNNYAPQSNYSQSGSNYASQSNYSQPSSNYAQQNNYSQSNSNNVQANQQKTQQSVNNNNQPKKNNNGVVKVCVIIVLIVIIVAVISLIIFSAFIDNSGEKESKEDKKISSTSNENKDEEDEGKDNNTGNSTNTPSSSSQEVKFSGFTLYIPDNLEYKIDDTNNTIQLQDEDSTWLANLMIQPVRYEDLKKNITSLKSELEETFKNVGGKVSDVKAETIDGVEFITIELSVGGTNELIVYTKLDSNYCMLIEVMNEDNDFDRETLKELLPIVETAKFSGEDEEDLKAGETINEADIVNMIDALIESSTEE